LARPRAHVRNRRAACIVSRPRAVAKLLELTGNDGHRALQQTARPCLQFPRREVSMPNPMEKQIFARAYELGGRPDAVYSLSPFGGRHHTAVEVRDDGGPVMQVKCTFEFEKLKH
jgi:hypothetical protein